MDIVAWVLVAVLAAAVGYLLFRRTENPYAGALDRLARELERGEEIEAAAADDPPEVAVLRRALAAGWEPVRPGEGEDPEERALQGLIRFLRGAALDPLRRVLANGSSTGAIQDVVEALEDLEYYAARPGVEAPSRQNLPQLIQEVVRDYTRETEIPVKLRFSSPTMQAQVPADAFRDALFLLLANAGRFGRGETVLVEAESSAEGVRVRVIDRGGGFSPEALQRAFDPFWSTDPDAVGLGLTHARRLLRPGGIQLRVGNREGAGGEAVIFLPAG